MFSFLKKIGISSRMKRVVLKRCGLEPLASWLYGPVRRTGGWAPREGIKRNRVGSPLSARCGAWPIKKLRSDYEAGVSPPNGESSTSSCSSEVRVSRRIERFSCAKKRAEIREFQAGTMMSSFRRLEARLPL